MTGNKIRKIKCSSNGEIHFRLLLKPDTYEALGRPRNVIKKTI